MFQYITSWEITKVNSWIVNCAFGRRSQSEAFQVILNQAIRFPIPICLSWYFRGTFSIGDLGWLSVSAATLSSIKPFSVTWSLSSLTASVLTRLGFCLELCYDYCSSWCYQPFWQFYAGHCVFKVDSDASLSLSQASWQMLINIEIRCFPETWQRLWF